MFIGLQHRLGKSSANANCNPGGASDRALAAVAPSPRASEPAVSFIAS